MFFVALAVCFFVSGILMVSFRKETTSQKINTVDGKTTVQKSVTRESKVLKPLGITFILIGFGIIIFVLDK